MKNILFISALVCFVACKKNPSPAPGAIIHSFAGTNIIGYTGDGGIDSSATLAYPISVSIDAHGNVYITDNYDNCVRKVNSLGVITTVAGSYTSGFIGDGGPATDAKLHAPRGAVADANGNIYIADVDNNRIRKVNTAGIISTFAGTGNSGYSGDSSAATAARLTTPSGVAVDTKGNVYIADQGNSCIRKVNAAGMITTIAGIGATGYFGYDGDGGAATATRLYLPAAVAVDGIGNVYIADTRNYRIRKVDTFGKITTLGGNGTAGFNPLNGAAIQASIPSAQGLALDKQGNLYFADAQNNNVREINVKGTITTIAGTGTAGLNGNNIPALTALLNAPSGVAVDSAGDILIADNLNHMVRKVTR
jgi:sugar lactone lactonase YvrE